MSCGSVDVVALVFLAPADAVCSGPSGTSAPFPTVEIDDRAVRTGTRRRFLSGVVHDSIRWEHSSNP